MKYCKRKRATNRLSPPGSVWIPLCSHLQTKQTALLIILINHNSAYNAMQSTLYSHWHQLMYQRYVSIFCFVWNRKIIDKNCWHSVSGQTSLDSPKICKKYRKLIEYHTERSQCINGMKIFCIFCLMPRNNWNLAASIIAWWW